MPQEEMLHIKYIFLHKKYGCHDNMFENSHVKVMFYIPQSQKIAIELQCKVYLRGALKYFFEYPSYIELEKNRQQKRKWDSAI